MEIELAHVISYWESFQTQPGYLAVDISGQTIIPATVKYLKELEAKNEIQVSL